MYKKDLLKFVQKELLITANEELIFSSCEYVSLNRDYAGFHPVNSNWLEYVQRQTANSEVNSGKKVCTVKIRGSMGVWSAVGVVQIYQNKRASKIRLGASVMYLLFALMLTFTVELQQRPICSVHTLVGFLPVELREVAVVCSHSPKCRLVI